MISPSRNTMCICIFHLPRDTLVYVQREAEQRAGGAGLCRHQALHPPPAHPDQGPAAHLGQAQKQEIEVSICHEHLVVLLTQFPLGKWQMEMIPKFN